MRLEGGITFDIEETWAVHHDGQEASKIFVYRGMHRLPKPLVLRLVAAMQAYGPTTLLWVELQDPDHPAGTVEWVATGLLKGYIDRFAPGEPDVRGTDRPEPVERRGDRGIGPHRRGFRHRAHRFAGQPGEPLRVGRGEQLKLIANAPPLRMPRRCAEDGPREGEARRLSFGLTSPLEGEVAGAVRGSGGWGGSVRGRGRRERTERRSV